ncbi:hypothetical protein LMG28138_06127 [Pararobbsia alpina]|uniref:Uncharacterized protein n=1 Tax=Pararobbsia alpina TaxID=621374 RepID=A0A6S7C463_9BURK|nr:hypothetical protein LMG28138_06127 [Pararobbsia alpina]
MGALRVVNANCGAVEHRKRMIKSASRMWPSYWITCISGALRHKYYAYLTLGIKNAGHGK